MMKFGGVFLLIIFSQHLFLDINGLRRFQRSALNDSNYIFDSDGLNTSSDSFLSNETDKNVNELIKFDSNIDQLKKDESKVGKQNGRNVVLSGFSGNINLTLKDSALTFKLCTPCSGSIQICYDSTSSNSDLQGSCAPSQCELKMDIEKTVVKFTDEMDVGTICDTLRIQNTKTKFNRIRSIKTCRPKIENGIIHLFLKSAEPGCHVEVVNADIKYPEIPTTTPPSSADKQADSTSTASFEWWKILLIIIVGLIVFGIFAFFGYLCYKKRWTSKTTNSPTTEEPKPSTVIPDAKESTKTIQNESKKKRPDLNFTKFEPTKSRKTQKKAAPKKEPTTTEEFVPPPPPTVTVASPRDPTKPIPKLPQYSIPQRLIPRSYKSLKTDSLEEVINKNKTTPVESVIDSVARNVLKEKNSELVQQMKKNYPEIKRAALQCEIVLFCVKISVMFTKMHEMIIEAEQILTNLGVQFDAEHRIASMTPEARQYLQHPKTPTIIVYFAFGAEYYQYITDDMTVLPKLSVAHQFVIALQPRFAELNRRKALTWLRRELPKFRENYTIVERNNLPFPINAIEKAFLHDPTFLISVSGIDTDSEADRNKIEESKVKQMLEKNEGGLLKQSKKIIEKTTLNVYL